VHLVQGGRKFLEVYDSISISISRLEDPLHLGLARFSRAEEVHDLSKLVEVEPAAFVLVDIVENLAEALEVVVIGHVESI
jgi:hypothetical protein